MKIRPAAHDDDKRVSEILRACWNFTSEHIGLTEAELNGLLQDRCQPEHVATLRDRFVCFVAEIDSVVGFMALSDGKIEELFVMPSHHRNGIGSALFNHAEEMMRLDGHGMLIVTTTGYGQPFYEAMGMKVVGEQAVSSGPLQGRNLICLEKKLPPDPMP